MYSRCVWQAVYFSTVLICAHVTVAGSKATPAPASDNIAYDDIVLNTVDGGGGGPAIEGAEIRVEKNKAYVTYSPPQTAAGGPQRAGENDVYDEIN